MRTLCVLWVATLSGGCELADNGRIDEIIAQLDSDGDGYDADEDVDDDDSFIHAGTFSNQMGIPMACISAGTFLMGSQGEVGGQSDETQHEVTLTAPFYIGAYEVTQAQFEAFGGQPSSFTDCPYCPAEDMTWSEAAAFANAVSSAAGLPTGRVGDVSVRRWEHRPWQRDDGHEAQPRTGCPGLWLTPVIRQDGHLLMCCADLHSELDLGDLSRHSFASLWEGVDATRRRLAHLDGRFEGVCEGCGGINWYSLSQERAEQAPERGRALGLCE